MTGRRLTGSRCLCRGCGEYFNSVFAFDRHRVWASPVVQRCRTHEELIGKGMSINASGFWITEPRRKHRVQPKTSRIAAALRETPVGQPRGWL
jgi:hypothetical protein